MVACSSSQSELCIYFITWQLHHRSFWTLHSFTFKQLLWTSTCLMQLMTNSQAATATKRHYLRTQDESYGALWNYAISLWAPKSSSTKNFSPHGCTTIPQFSLKVNIDLFKNKSNFKETSLLCIIKLHAKYSSCWANMTNKNQFNLIDGFA